MTSVPKLPPYARVVEGGIEIRVKVVPRASRSEIVGVHGDRLKVRVAAAPERGKANRALLDLLRRWLAIRDLEIIAGASGSEKTVRASGGETILEIVARVNRS